MNRSNNIFLVGPMGAGKSTIGKHLADTLKLRFYDTDRVIEERSGVEISWIFDLEGEVGFRKREEALIHELCEKHGIVLGTGGGAVVSEDNRAMLSSRGVVVYLKASLAQQVERTERDKRRPQLQVEDRKEALEQLDEDRMPLYSEVADIIIETKGKSIKSVINEIISHLDAGDF